MTVFLTRTKSKAPYLITAAVLLLAAAAAATVIWLLKSSNENTELKQAEPTVQTGFLMDTYIRQTTYDSSPDAGEKLRQMFDFLSEFENKASMYLSDSEISNINSHSGVMPVKVSDDIFQLLSRSKELCLQSEGRFDITIGALTKLWGITTDSPKVPSEEEIKDAQKLVDINQLVLDAENKTAKLNAPYMSLDLGGVAKGYACDLAREKYKELGLTSCLLSLGGNIYSFGTKADGTAFVIGLRDPLGDADDIFGTVTAPDKVISTTGGYERYFEQDGKRYHHVLDPKTGYPAGSDLLSVTIIAEEGLLADCLSTSLFVGGKEAVLKNLSQTDFDVIAVDQEKNIYLSDGIRSKFQLSEGSVYQVADSTE